MILGARLHTFCWIVKVDKKLGNRNRGMVESYMSEFSYETNGSLFGKSKKFSSIYPRLS